MNNLWGELNTSNIPQVIRQNMEKTLSECEEKFKLVVQGQIPLEELHQSLMQCDHDLAMAVITQAKAELSKSEHQSAPFKALEELSQELSAGQVQPTRARHQVKQIVRAR
ncbi:MAG: hypothetical protein HY324_00420 [Chlamydiia bacterium]|nr:hypothetical protein [Chlamydiia bacterium]